MQQHAASRLASVADSISHDLTGSTALPTSEEDALMTPEEMVALSQATVLGICKGAIASGWKPDWKARAEWLTAQGTGK